MRARLKWIAVALLLFVVFVIAFPVLGSLAVSGDWRFHFAFLAFLALVFFAVWRFFPAPPKDGGDNAS